MAGYCQSGLIKSLLFLSLIIVSMPAELPAQSKLYVNLFAETQSNSDRFYGNESVPFLSAGVGYNISQHMDVHSGISFANEPQIGGMSETTPEILSRTAMSVLLGFNIKPWGTIINNEQTYFGRFTPYIGIELKERTITEKYRFESVREYEWILIGNLGTEVSLSRLFSLFANAGYKYPASYSYSVPQPQGIHPEIAHPDVNLGFGLKLNLL